MKTNLAILLKRLRSRGLAHSAHRGRIKLQRGYVSKSSAALNPLTIMQLSSLLAERWVADRVPWPGQSISGAHAYNAPMVCTLVPFIILVGYNTIATQTHFIST